MPPEPIRHRIPARVSTRALTTTIGEKFAVRAAIPAKVRRSFLDTADWRVYGAGWTLEADVCSPHSVSRDEPGVTVVLRNRDSEGVVAEAHLAAMPDYATDLPKSGAWGDVAVAVETRRLLVQIDTDARVQRLDVLNDDRKTTARIIFERHAVEEPDSERKHIVRIASVTPIRGYERTAARASELLEGAGTPRRDRSLLANVLSLTGRPSPGTKLGPGVALHRSMTARQALAAILERLRFHVVVNEQGTREQLDIEFLHEYRVAVRRARSMVKRVEGVLDPAVADGLGTELKWLGDLTSPVRDYDVFLEELGPPEAGDDLDPLRRFLESRRVEAQAELIRALDSDRYTQLLEMWRTAAEGPVDPEVAPAADRPAGEAADDYIHSALRRVLRRGAAIGPDTPAEALHDLRKRAKELRYLLECFQTLYPDDRRTAVVKELKALQDNLGEYQDCQVQAETLRAMAEALLEERRAPASALMAMGRLAEDQERREFRARDEFDARFARFSSRENRRRYAALVDEVGAGDGAPE